MMMRSHTNGGYANLLDECWRMCEMFNVNIVIMYDHVSCKTSAVCTACLRIRRAREAYILFGYPMMLWIRVPFRAARCVKLSINT